MIRNQTLPGTVVIFDLLKSDGISIPNSWHKSDRIKGAFELVRNTIDSETLLKRIAEAKRVEEITVKWMSQEIFENYIACIIEGKILIGS